MKSAIVASLICCFALTAAYVITWFHDSNVPEIIEEPWKVKIIDASMRFYKKIGSILVSLDLMTPFSQWDRYLADLILLAQITGLPWSSYRGPDLQVTNMVMSGTPVRVYEPKSSMDQILRPAVIYIHGGAWTLLSVDSYEPFTSRLAVDAEVVVISVSYRQSPQFPFPVPRKDSMAVVKYVLQHSSDLRIDSKRIALAGDSCGGNLVASLVLELKKSVAMQILLVPALQPINTLTPSAIENGFYMSNSINDRLMYSSYLLYGGISLEAYPFLISNTHVPRDLQRHLNSSFLSVEALVPAEIIRTPELKPKEQKNGRPHSEEKSVTKVSDKQTSVHMNDHHWAEKISNVFLDPLFSPLLADDEVLRQSPRSYVMTAGYDVIRDDGVMYHHRLKRLGIPGAWKHYPQAFHHACLFHSGPLKLTVGQLIFQDVVNYIIKFL